MLPETTIRTLDRLSKPGERSRLIVKAVLHYATTRSAEGLREQLKQAALRDRDLDEETAEEWIGVDQESWQQLDLEKKPTTQQGFQLRLWRFLIRSGL